MKEIDLAGWVLLPIGRAAVNVDYINWEKRSWLVPKWIDVPNKDIRVPLRLIAPRFVQGHVPPQGPEILNIFKRLQLPDIVFDADNTLSVISPLIDLVERPALFLRSMQAMVA